MRIETCSNRPFSHILFSFIERFSTLGSSFPCDIDDFQSKQTGQIMLYEVEPVSKPRILGEGPHWDDETQNLYFVDDFGSSIHRFRPSENRETYCKVHDSASVSIVIPIKNTKNKFAVTMGKNLSIVTWDGESTTPQNVEIIAGVDDEAGKEKNQFNDGKVDAAGRLWCGTMGPVNADGTWTPYVGSLYSIRKNEKPLKHLTGLSIANGLIWKKDGRQFFYIDSPTRKIDVFDFDENSGTISNRRLFFDVTPHLVSEMGGPDGMTIDENDNLWVVLFGSAAIININGTTGEFIRKIQLPVTQPTSAAFGGPLLDELYVTSATFGLSDDVIKRYPLSGCTLRVKGLGVKGRKAMPADF